MSPPAPEKKPPAALRQDGTAPRSRAERLRMLGILVAISLAVSIPTLVVTGIFGQRPKPKAPPAVRDAPPPTNGLMDQARLSASTLLPDPAVLEPGPVVVTVRPEHLAARLETVRRQAVRFGGTATEGVPSGGERLLFVDLPAAATDAFRQAVVSPASSAAAGPVPSSPASPPGGLDHVTVIIRPMGDDE